MFLKAISCIATLGSKGGNSISQWSILALCNSFPCRVSYLLLSIVAGPDS